MHLACALALLLVAPPTVAPTPGPAGEAIAPAFPDGPAGARKDGRARQAAADHAARRYGAAAAEYEALFAEFSEPGFLLQAARAREAARQHAHAVAYLSRLVASGQLTAADTQVAYGELQAAQRGVTPVTVRVELPAELQGASPLLTAEFMPLTPDEQRPALEFPLPPGAGAVRVVMLQLDAGPWRLRVDDPALAPADVLVHVQQQPGAPVQLDLRPPQDTGLPQPQRRRLVGLLGGLGGAMLGAGIGLTVRGELAQVQPALREPASSCDDLLPCRQALASAAAGRSVGAGLIGAGGGALIGGLTGLISDPRQRRTAWILELALGGAGVVGGSFAVALAARGFDRENFYQDDPWGPDYITTIDRRADQHTLAAAGLGLGSGLAFSAAAGLMRTRIYHHRHRLQPAFSVRSGGLALSISGAF